MDGTSNKDLFWWLLSPLRNKKLNPFFRFAKKHLFPPLHSPPGSRACMCRFSPSCMHNPTHTYLPTPILGSPPSSTETCIRKRLMFPLLPFASEIFCSPHTRLLHFSGLSLSTLHAACHPLDNAYTNDTTPSPLRLYCVDTKHTHNDSPLDIFCWSDILTLTISTPMQPYYVRVGLGWNENSCLATLFSLRCPQRHIEFFSPLFSILISVSRPEKSDIRPLPTSF